MAQNLKALQDALSLVADVALDVDKAVSAGGSVLSQLPAFANLIGDVEALVPELGEIPQEWSQLQAGDYVTLVEGLVTKLAISNAHAQAVVQAGLKVLNDLVGILPDMKALIDAIKNPPAPPAATTATAS